MTILQVIQKSTEFLERKGVESPRLQVELLLAHVLRCPRMNLYLNFERVLSEAELATLRTLVQRRGAREPLQYITGSTSFCGLEIAVNPHVLIPRPETELLAERAWKFLQQVSQTNASPVVLDYGTGSGCIAISLAAKVPQAQVHALDISSDALSVAGQNAAKNNCHERIIFHQGDGFGSLPTGLKFNLIVSNPPYIPTAEIDTLQPEVKDHEPRGALDGGPDGLDFYRRLAVEAVPWLAPGGRIMLEFGDGQAPAIQQIFQQQNWIVEAVEPDYTQRPRMLIAYVTP